MTNEFSRQLSRKDLALLVNAMENLRDNLRSLSETVDQASIEIQESEVANWKEVADEVIAKIKLQQKP